MYFFNEWACIWVRMGQGHWKLYSCCIHRCFCCSPPLSPQKKSSSCEHKTFPIGLEITIFFCFIILLGLVNVLFVIFFLHCFIRLNWEAHSTLAVDHHFFFFALLSACVVRRIVYIILLAPEFYSAIFGWFFLLLFSSPVYIHTKPNTRMWSTCREWM